MPSTSFRRPWRPGGGSVVCTVDPTTSKSLKSQHTASPRNRECVLAKAGTSSWQSVRGPFWILWWRREVKGQTKVAPKHPKHHKNPWDTCWNFWNEKASTPWIRTSHVRVVLWNGSLHHALVLGQLWPNARTGAFSMEVIETYSPNTPQHQPFLSLTDPVVTPVGLNHYSPSLPWPDHGCFQLRSTPSPPNLQSESISNRPKTGWFVFKTLLRKKGCWNHTKPSVVNQSDIIKGSRHISTIVIILHKDLKQSWRPGLIGDAPHAWSKRRQYI